MKTEKKKKLRIAFNRWKSAIGRDALLPVTDTFLLEMADDGILTIRGCHEVLTCASDRIVLMTDLFLITLDGEEMLLDTFSERQTSVRGRIRSVGFEKEWQL